MIYTGLYPVRNGCFINHTEIRSGVKTLPVYLKALGYDTILAGKSHVNPMDQFPWTEWFRPQEQEGMPRPASLQADGFLFRAGRWAILHGGC